MTKLIPLLAIPVLLAACAPPLGQNMPARPLHPEKPAQTPPPDFAPSCGADRLQGLIGQDAGVIGELQIDGPLRVIHPGMAVTMDYRPDRLNIEVDEDGIIVRVWCV